MKEGEKGRIKGDRRKERGSEDRKGEEMEREGVKIGRKKRWKERE